MPESFTIDTSTLTRTSVRLNWQAPLNYDCMITYYNILVNGMTYTVNSNYTWYNLSVNFGSVYCPIISARDTAMRSGVTVPSIPRCIDVNGKLAGDDSMITMIDAVSSLHSSTSCRAE